MNPKDYKEKVYQIIGAAMTVHRTLGLLINFGNDSLHGERYAYDDETNTCYLLDKYMNRIPMDEDGTNEWYEDPYCSVK